MDAKAEGRIFGFLAIALALFGFAVPYRWHEMPPIISNGALGLSAVFAILAVWLLIPPKFRKKGGRLNQWLPWVLIIGGPIIGAVWLYFGREVSLPGFTSYARGEAV